MPDDTPSILFVNRVLPPSRGATGRCLADLAGRMAAMGWKVTIVRDGPAEDAGVPGVQVVGTGGQLAGGDAPDARAYLDSLRRLVGRAVRLPRHGLVVTMTDPPLLALAGPVLKARHGAPAIHWSHDLYPSLLPVLGIRFPRPLMAMAESATLRALRHHDAVVAIGRCMAARLAAMGVPSERITLLPNWPDPVIRSIPHAANPFRAAHGLEGKFVVAYSGNLGLAHPMDGVLAAAERLAHSDPHILFLMIGEGRGHAAVARAAANRGLPNLRLLPFQPGERLAESLSSADLHLASMDPRAAGLLVPSKVAGAQAAGRPCLFLGPGESEAARLVEGCGEVLDPHDDAGLADAVRRYAADPSLCRTQGGRALAWAADWDADRAAARFAALAAGLLRPAGPVGGWLPARGRRTHA